MSKVTFSIIPFIFIVLLSVFFFISPRFFSQETQGSGEEIKNIIIQRYLDVGNLIAHATFVEDAIIMEQASNLNEIIVRYRRDQEDITYIHFTDAKNEVLASSQPELVGQEFTSNLLESGASVVKENNGIFEGGFSITVGRTVIGALFLGARTRIPSIKASSSSSNPIVLVIGIVVGIFVFIITLSLQKNLKAKIVDDINKRQEEVFSPKIESLKKAQQTAQQNFDDMNKKVDEKQKALRRLTDEYEAQKKEIESNPVVQSIEKLKQNETELLKRLEKIKGEEQQLSKEVALLTQKKEEIQSALEAEKKEERTLHEKLDLIKKKILHLETPKK